MNCTWCGKRTVKRMNSTTGKSFIGCSAWPRCKWTEDGVTLQESSKQREDAKRAKASAKAERAEQKKRPKRKGSRAPLLFGDTDNGFCGIDDFDDSYGCG